MPHCKVTAIGLRYALKLSTSKIAFKIPITYLEKLKDGGFYEAKSTVMTNLSHRSVKWCLDLRHVNKVTEEGIFKGMYFSSVQISAVILCHHKNLTNIGVELMVGMVQGKILKFFSEKFKCHLTFSINGLTVFFFI